MNQKRLGPNNRILLNLFKIFSLAWMKKKNLPEILWPHPSLYPLFCNKAARSKGRKTKALLHLTQQSCYGPTIPAAGLSSFPLPHLESKAVSSGEEEKTWEAATMTQTKAPQLTFRALGQRCSEGWSAVREVGLEGKLHLQESKWKWLERWDWGAVRTINLWLPQPQRPDPLS